MGRTKEVLDFLNSIKIVPIKILNKDGVTTFKIKNNFDSPISVEIDSDQNGTIYYIENNFNTHSFSVQCISSFEELKELLGKW